MERSFGYVFKEPALCYTAVTHRSAGADHNERLEFLEMCIRDSYSSGLDQRGVLADLLIEADEQQPVVTEAAAHVAP